MKQNIVQRLFERRNWLWVCIFVFFSVNETPLHASAYIQLRLESPNQIISGTPLEVPADWALDKKAWRFRNGDEALYGFTLSHDDAARVAESKPVKFNAFVHGKASLNGYTHVKIDDWKFGRTPEVATLGTAGARVIDSGLFNSSFQDIGSGYANNYWSAPISKNVDNDQVVLFVYFSANNGALPVDAYVDYALLEIEYSSAPKISTSTVPKAAFGVPYSATLSAEGGYPPYSWTLVKGRLPAGLRLNQATGEISGIPSEAVSFEATFQVSRPLKNPYLSTRFSPERCSKG